MVHYITTARCRRFGGSLLVALLTAWCGSQALAEEAFEADAVSVSFDEGVYFLAASHPGDNGPYVRNPARTGGEHGHTAGGTGTNSSTNGAANSLLNREIDAARTTPALADACYTVAVTDAAGKASDLFALAQTADCESSVASNGANDGTMGATGGHVKMKADAILDYETSSKYVIKVHAHKGDKVVDTLTLTLNLNDVNEAPVVQAPFTYEQNGADRSGDDLQPVGASRVYMNAGESTSISFNRMFRDLDATPEALVIDTANQSVCDNGMANTPGVDGQIHSSAAPSVLIGRGASRGYLWPGLRDIAPARDGNYYCVINDTARGDPTPHPGQHVVKLSVQGQRLILTAYDQTTPGTYLAQVYAQLRRSFDENGAIVPTKVSSTFAKITVIVKKGVNNPPAFAGGSVGFRTTVNEGTGEDALVASVVPGTTAATADDWNAGDLDTQDTDVYYKVVGTPCPAKDYSTYTLTEGGSCWKYQDNSGNVSLTGALVDYEKLPAGKMATVRLQASDGYDTVTIPITVTVKDVNELEVDTEAVTALGTVRLTNDEKSDPIELASLFIDPEGDPLTFSAYSNLREDLVKIEGRDLVLTGKGATATAEKTYTITVTASDGKLSRDATFTLKVRAKNVAPSFEPAEVRSFGMSVAEDAPVGTFLATAITYLDADSADEVQATVDSELFEAVRVGRLDANENGKIDGGESSLCELPLKMTVSKHCRKVASELGLRTKARLNAEQQDRHTLTLTLDDGWDKSGTVLVHVIVTDVNDLPMVKLDAAGKPLTIADQVVAVGGSLTLAVGGYFTDEDGDRLKVDAISSMKQVATVTVSGLDQLTIHGLSEGMATITLTADDGEGGTVSLTFMVKVTTNRPPVADKDAFMARLLASHTLNVGETFDLTLTGLFTDPDEGDMVGLPQAMTSDEAVLLVVVTNDGATATLVGRASGMATLTLTATDEAGNKTSVSQAITVNAAPAEAQPLAARTLNRVTPQAVDLGGLFTDADDGADGLVITATPVGEGAARATATVAGTTLTLAGVALGEVDIQLTATDPHGATATSTLMATVVNVPPTVAMDVAPQELDRMDPLTVDVSDVFVDADGELATLEATAADERIVAIDLADGLLTLTGLAVGETAVTVHATDHDGDQAMTTVTVAVVNVPPTVATEVGPQTLTRIRDLMYDASALFRDPDTNEPLALKVAVADPMVAMAAVAGHRLTVEGLHVGSTTVTVTATDVDGDTAAHEFVVAVKNVTPTVAMQIDAQTFDRRAPLGLDLTGTFMDDDGEIRTLTAMVADGSVVDAVMAGAALTLQALAVGTTTVTVTAMDDQGDTIATAFEVTVANVPPVVAEAVADQTTTRVADLTLDVSGTFHDPDTDAPVTVTVVAADGGIVETALREGMLTLRGLAVGSTTLTLTAMDVDGDTVSTTFMTTVANVRPEVAQAMVDQEMDRRAPLTLDVAPIFQDEDDGPTALSLTVMTADSDVAEAMLQGSRLTVTARAVGATEVMLTATDANRASVTDTFEVTVLNVAPVVAAAVMDQTITRVADVALDVSGVFSDPDTDEPLTLMVTTAEATLVEATLGADHRLTLHGLAVGETVLTLTATDMDGGHVMDEVQVTVANVAPQVANSLSPLVLEVGGAAATPTIEGLFSDDGDPLTYTVATADAGIATAALAGTQARVRPIARGSTMLTITATDPHGDEATVRGSVTVGDGALKAVAAQSLAGFGRALLASASSSVGARLTTDARSADLTLDAWLDEWAPRDPAAASRTVAAQGAAAWQLVHAVNTPGSTGVLAGDAMAGSSSGTSGALSGMDQLQSQFGQRFALNLGSSEDASRWSVWGDVDRQTYEGSGYDGTATSVYLGADVAVAECWLLGLAVARQGGDSDYAWGTASQAMDMQLTTVLPYASYRPNERMSLWGVAGFGRGELDTTVAGTTTTSGSDLRSQLAMVGGEQALRQVGRFDLALRGDAALASLETDQGLGAADGLATDVHRLRLGLEGSFSTDTGEGGMLEPFGQVNVRTDGGDGATGSGLELAGGIRMTTAAFTLEAQGRTLALHGADDYREAGFSLLAILNPSAQATGILVTIAPRWGADAVGTGILWEDTLRVGQSYGVLTGMANGGAQASLETQLGYGLLVARERYLLTPFVDVRMSDGTRRELLVGASVRPWVRQAKDLDVRLAAGRVNERPGVSHSQVGLHATMRF